MLQVNVFSNTVPARQFQRGYKKVFDRVRRTGEPMVVMANNQPQTAIVSLEMLFEYQKMKLEQEAFAAIDRIRYRNMDKNPDEVYVDVTEEVERMRRKRK